MESERSLVLPVGGPELADFILSLLGQRRRIENPFEVKSLIVRHEELLNLLETVTQRVAQNASELVTLKCSFYFYSGRSVTVLDRASFVAFDDNSQEQTIGVDLTLVFLVRFAGSATPEKQDIRIEIFSDTYPRANPGSPPRRRRVVGWPMLKYTIETTNLTCGEDISHHLNKGFATLAFQDQLSKCVDAVISFLKTPVLFFTFMGVFGTAAIAIGAYFDYNAAPSLADHLIARLGTTTGIDLVNDKLDVLLALNRREPSNFWNDISQPRNAAAIGLLPLLLLSAFLAARYGRVRIVACNKFTRRRLEELLKTRENIKWAVLAALIVGLITGVMATRLDTLLFHG